MAAHKATDEIMNGKQCPRANSDMTPCYLKDGVLAIAFAFADRRVCVGCGCLIATIRNLEAA